MMTQQATLEMVNRAIKDFQTSVFDSQIRELHAITSRTDAKLQEASGAFGEIRVKFDAIETERIAKILEMETAVSNKLDIADTEFKSYQTILGQDLKKVDELFHQTDAVVKQVQLGLESTKIAVKESAQNTGQEIVNMAGNFQQFKAEVDNSHRLLQGSLSAAISTSAAAQSLAGGSGPKSRTLDEDRRLEGVGQISGHETLAAITEWYSKNMIKIESACPGSTAVLEWAIAQDEEITSESINSARTEDRFTCHRLNRESISWMANVFTSKACSHAKPEKQEIGLEAWRLVHRNITMQGPQQVQIEYSYLLKPAEPSKNGDIAQWISEWEDRASKLSMPTQMNSAAPSSGNSSKLGRFKRTAPTVTEEEADIAAPPPP